MLIGTQSDCWRCTHPVFDDALTQAGDLALQALQRLQLRRLFLAEPRHLGLQLSYCLRGSPGHQECRILMSSGMTYSMQAVIHFSIHRLTLMIEHAPSQVYR